MPLHKEKKQSLALKTLSIFIALTLSYSALSTEVYKWTDEHGNTHYSDKKPNKSKHESLDVYSGKTSATRKDIYKQTKDLDSMAQTAAEEQKKADEEAAQKQQLEKQCQTIRDNLKTISETSRIRVMQDGEARYLSAKEIANRKQQHEQQLKDFCQ